MATSPPQARSTSALNPPPVLSGQHPAFGDSLRRRRRSSHSSHGSHDSHGSDSSHSSHSSYAERHPDRVPQKAASPNNAFLSVVGLLALVLTYTLVGVWLFVKGFLLTRHELTGISECSKSADGYWTLPSPPATTDDEALLSWAQAALDPITGEGECRLAPTHSKAVVLIVDALRYDFIAPPPPSGSVANESGWSPNPHYHNVLTLPAELTAKHGIPAFADRPGPASFVAHFTADPPTTTLQRLKGLTTGTLPTFFEAGANFGSAGTGVGQVNEDNWIAQFKRSISSSGASNAGLVFAGDDTWSTVFPDLFDADTTWTYDSFNVEDLDTVDRGVEAKLLPFLQRDHPERKAGVHDSWRLLVGHTLGVDHVGHRFGASHAKMKVKLQEMQLLLQNITDAVDDETLVVVMGDHGMDERGDHGGDAELEIGAGLWMYSKSGFGHTGRRKDLRPDPAEYLSSPDVEAISPSRIPFTPLPSPPYPSDGHRSIPQIDLVPTLSILLGLPVPYNNLGSVVPDLFSHPHTLLRALRITATQMRTYVAAYSKHSPDLAAFQPEFDARWLDAVRADAELAHVLYAGRKKTADDVEVALRRAAQAYHRFNRVSLGRAREVWAQFDMVRIALGLAVLVLTLVCAWVVRGGAVDGLVGVLHSGGDDEKDGAQAERGGETAVKRRTETTQELYAVVWKSVSRPLLVGAVLGAGLHYTTLLPLPAVVASILQPLTLLDSMLGGATLTSQLSLLSTHLPSFLQRSPLQDTQASSVPATTTLLNTAGWLALLVHALLFTSNSFLVFEDRFVLLALTSLLFIRGVLLVGSSPNTRTKLRAGVLCVIALVCIRLAAIARVCREEQAPYCENTFFSSSSTSSGALNSPYIIAGAYVFAYLLPGLIGKFLEQSKSNVGIARVFAKWVLRPTLMTGAGVWAMDWASPLDAVQRGGWGPTLETVKQWTVKVDLVVLGVVAVAFWVFAPLCLEIRREGGEHEGQQPKVTILGYANSFGSSYVLLVGVVVGLLWVVTQPMGQLAVGLVWVAAMACVELGDAERDVVVLHRQRLASQSSPGSTTPAAAAAPPTPTRPIHLTSAEISTYALLAHLVFFSTGHQATLASIQWRLAFLTSPTLTYPLSPLLVALNSFGHLTLLPPLLTTLGVLWNATPLPRGSGRRMATPRQLLSGLMTLHVYALAVLVSTALVSGLLFRRHLMLFKVWTPRFMLASVWAVGGQMAAVAAVLAAWQTSNKVNRIFGSEFA
ncbi:hypothetical protein EX895_006443 [Sporisorium graminicola]|uniref:Uncharacterized protein n=1 Tax=Sporisorium graminicola TaxID=280036 RepID=A0A4U7KKE5_9BASI|nr:hypothetical protein EX895_006443 [Sporisorium graminicola]TKY84541.1 hypothetical protein EX895_006443 [Sporisorium graminicola]